MKKLFILLILFIISVAVAMGLVVKEQIKRSQQPNSLQTPEQSTPTLGTGQVEFKASPTIPPVSREGNITLQILSPQDKTTTTDATVTVRGKTTPGANVMVNEFEMTAGADGTFSKNLTLDDGENYISVAAYTVNGAVAEQELVVIKEVAGY